MKFILGIFVGVFFCASALGAVKNESGVASMTFTNKEGESCTMRAAPILGVAIRSSLQVQCGSKKALQMTVNGTFKNAVRDATGGDRLFLNWDIGNSLTRLLVVITRDIQNRGVSAEVILDVSSHFASDILFSPDVVLVHKGQDTSASGEQLPTETEIFQWDSVAYKSVATCSWKNITSFADRLAFLKKEGNACGN